ncbi:DUF4176 domain-containing protein [Sporolactobacillus sp. Y61]|jgi:hypothetical protein|uniref:DUF4176 domain-containing protein n=1 Tax=Sporolactobacillus sp. Y61 TaxID=3160863 RepID=A0AAU8IFZ1_9BACL|nr:DUF4176 domain-containing protein [Sporolactobacillus sp. THM19-2]RYL87087.1 DUF4176 domain-containing protein [Sporolactobacillus sp. THM19-2]
MKVLPIGSVVRLKNGDVKLMILNRAPLYNKNGVIGYFDYSACIYPTGKVEEQVYFFNHENIEEIYFKGYIDEEEELFQKQYQLKMKDIPYERFLIEG